MDTIAHNFVYDPLRQGADASVWRFYQGQPYQAGQYIAFNDASALMYYDIGRGLISYTINVPHAPQYGDARSWGLYSGGDYALFKIQNDVFSVTTSCAGLTTSNTLTWSSTWTATDTVFAIRWEAGGAYFFINGYKYSIISDASIPSGALSPFVSNQGSDSLLIKKIMGSGLQSLVLNPVISAGDAVFAFGFTDDNISLTDSIVVSII